MVQLRAERDPERPLGHARIVVEGLTPAPATADFIIRREGYQEANLGRTGWQVREERLSPVAILAQSGATVLIVGPSVTRHLESMPYSFEIPSSKVEGHVFWPVDIDVFDGELQTQETMAAPITDSRREPEPKPPPDPEPKREAEQKREPEPRRDPGPEPGPEPKPVPRWWVLPLVAVLALAVVGTAIWLWREKLGGAAPAETPTAETPTQPAQGATGITPPPTTATNQAAPAAPAASWPDGTDGLSPIDVVRLAPNAAGIHAVAVRRYAAGRYDDALLLFEEAGDRGSAPSLTALAKLYDPIGFVAGRPFRNPDLRAAAKYYKEAVGRGDADAAAPRAALHAFLENEARGGNSSAVTALKDYWP